MMDPYSILGVSKTASDAEIKSAHRKLAKQLHPDLNPDQPDVAERFKQVSAAYALLSDPEKRRRFDAGEIDAQGNETPQYQYSSHFGGGPRGAQGGFEGHVDFEDLLSGIFGQGGRRGGGFAGGFGGGQRRQAAAKGRDISYRLEVDFLEAAKGAKKRVNLPDGRSLDVTIPEGTRDGQSLRLKGQGDEGFGGGPKGDALVEIRVKPHKFFHLDGNDIRVEVPVSLKEAVFGATIEVPTVDGAVKLPVPKHANSGTVLRLKDKGLKDRKSGKRGHQYVTLKVMLPDESDAKLEEFLKDWEPAQAHDPRAGIKKMV